MSVAVKICGLQDREALHAAVEGGADYIGFVLIPDSRHYVTVSKAKELLLTLPSPALCRFAPASPHPAGNEITLTGLFVDPTDRQIEEAMALKPLLGLIQLHGHETPERVVAVRAMTGLPVMKVIPVAKREDLDLVRAYEQVTDMLLFDTKLGPTPTGGTGKSFDWQLLNGQPISLPWMLAGGLNAQNVAKAVSLTGASIVDVSSGVETKGHKDPGKIKNFIRLCHAL